MIDPQVDSISVKVNAKEQKTFQCADFNPFRYIHRPQIYDNPSIKVGEEVPVRFLSTMSLEHIYVHWSVMLPVHAMREISTLVPTLGIGRGLWVCEMGMNLSFKTLSPIILILKVSMVYKLALTI